eukprot:TCONS_00016239-protein
MQVKPVTGGYVVEKLGNIIARGNFDRTERQTSSTYCELLAVKYILLSFPKILENENIEWFTDNNNICRIINRGSTKQHLQNLAIEILTFVYRPTLKFTLLGSLES